MHTYGMNIRSFFHNPDVCFEVIGRRAAENFLDMMLWYGEVMMTNGRSLTWNSCFASDMAYRSAVCRLRKSGVIAGHPDVGRGRILNVYDGRLEQSERFNKPDRFWKRRWSGRWNVLVYDIPEKEAVIRNGLRRFMRNLHMGCLQRSVWVSPWDMRPDYDDLVQTIQIQFESYLFEAETVLGRSQRDIVLNAWNFDKLGMTQSWYLKICRHNLAILAKRKLNRLDYENLAREEMSAYHVALVEDPLLPNELLPSGYLGKKVFAMHKTFVNRVKAELERGP